MATTGWDGATIRSNRQTMVSKYQLKMTLTYMLYGVPDFNPAGKTCESLQATSRALQVN